MSIAVYILVMAGVTYLIRMLPFAFFRKKIKSRFFRSKVNELLTKNRIFVDDPEDYEFVLDYIRQRCPRVKH